MSGLQFKLAMLDKKHKADIGNKVSTKSLRVFYGWAKLGKIRKKEAISVIFENEKMREEKALRAINKYQDTVFVRLQTDVEKQDAASSTRMFTEYSIFLEDKKIKGSLELALKANSEADKNHISEDIRSEISTALRSHYLLHHPSYKEPVIQTENDKLQKGGRK